MSAPNGHHLRRFRLLDVGFELSCADPACFSLLDRLFIAPEFRPGACGATVRATFDLGAAEPAGGGVAVGAERVSIGSSGDLPVEVLEWAFRAFLQKSRDYHLVHAGSLVRSGQGVLLVGPPYAGKTTLTLALCQEGFQYFSDDIGALGRGDGRLHPFRRRAGIRLAGGGRDYVAPDDGSDHPSAATPCPLAWIFILDAPRPPHPSEPASWTLILNEVAGTPTDPPPETGLVIMASSRWGGGLRLDFAPVAGRDLDAGLRAWLGPRPDGLLYLGPTPCDWTGSPQGEPALKALTVSEAAHEVLRHTLNRAGQRELVDRYGAHPHLQVFAELLEITSSARCFRLRAGSPIATARLLRRLVDADEQPLQPS